MLQWIAVLSMALVGRAAAPTDQELGLKCITGWPTTSFIVSPVTGKDVVAVDVIHHNGTAYMPIHEGVIVPHDFELLAKRAEKLTALGTSYRFEFPRSSCKVIADKVFQCADYKAPPVVLNGHKVSAMSIYSEASTNVSFAGTFKNITMTLYLDIDGESLFLPMRYSDNECLHM